jgi:hypothetical protein
MRILLGKLCWKTVPTLRFYTFTDGYKILKGLMGQIKDRNNPEYQKYFNELMNTHDLRIKYTDEFWLKVQKCLLLMKLWASKQ